jgi:hypothetical protein
MLNSTLSRRDCAHRGASKMMAAVCRGGGGGGGGGQLPYASEKSQKTRSGERDGLKRNGRF